MLILLSLLALIPLSRSLPCPTSLFPSHRYSHLISTHTQFFRDYQHVHTCMDAEDQLNLAYDQLEGLDHFPALMILGEAGEVRVSMEIRTDDALVNDMKIRGLRCSGRERYLIGHASSKYVSHNPSVE